MVRPKPPEIKDRFIDLQDTSDVHNLLVYGDSGCGKTVFAGSADKVAFISIESGTVSAKLHGSTAKVWPVKKWDDLTDAYNYLEKELEDNPGRFDWIVVDSLTRMQQLALRAILDDVVAENGSRDLDIPAIQDHQKWQNMFKRFVLAFCDLPVNTVFTALSLQAEDEEGEPFLTPDILGKGYQISQYVCSLMSAYGYMKVQRVPKLDAEGKAITKDGKKVSKIARRIIWQDNGLIRAKSRYPALTPYTQDKTLAEVAQLIEQPAVKKTAEPTPTRRPATTRRRSTT